MTVNFSLALGASHLVTYADGGRVPKSYPANLNIAIYTKHTSCNAATEWLQKKQEDDDLGSAGELQTMTYWASLDFADCSVWAIDCTSGSTEACASHCQHQTTCRINTHQRKSCVTNYRELKLRQIPNTEESNVKGKHFLSCLKWSQTFHQKTWRKIQYRTAGECTAERVSHCVLNERGG